MDGYVLSAKDYAALKKLIYSFNRSQDPRGNTPQRPERGSAWVEHEEIITAETLVARTPSEGIPGLVENDPTGNGDQPGVNDCLVFKVVPPDSLDPTDPEEMNQIGVQYKRVYNMSTSAIPGDQWILIERDKFGKWWVVEPGAGSDCFVVELTSEWEVEHGYSWKRMIKNHDGSFSDHPSGETGRDADTPDEDHHFLVGTRGWLCAVPGTGTGSGSGDAEYVFIPVYRTRTTCEGGRIKFQESLDGGETWSTIEVLGPCEEDGTGTTPADQATGPCELARLKTCDCVLAVGPENSVVLANGAPLPGSHWVSPPGTGPDDLLSYLGQSGPVEFWIEGGQPHLSVDGLELMWCGNNCFTGGPATGHQRPGTDTTDTCEGEVFTVCVFCTACIPKFYCVYLEGTGGATEVLLLTACEADALGSAIADGPFDTEGEATAACSTPLDCCPGVNSSNTPMYVKIRTATDLSGTTVATATMNWNGTYWKSGPTTVPCLIGTQDLWFRYTTACLLQYSCNDIDWHDTGGTGGCSITCSPFCDPGHIVTINVSRAGCSACGKVYFAAVSLVNDEACFC